MSAALIAILALAFPHTASAQHRLAAPFVDAGTVVLVRDGTPSDIDPASNESSYGDTIVRNIDQTLVALKGSSTDRYMPVLATSWGANADKSVWTFHLRHGVAFHTGRCCMTAADVQYSLGRSVAAGLAGSFLLGRFLSNPFKQIRIVDPYTVQFDLGRSQPMFLAAIASAYTPFILDAQALKAHETKHDWGHAWAQDHDAGTGPYRLQSWEHGQQVVLTRFPAYWGGWSGAHFSKVILRSVPDPATRRELVERGQADITFDLTPQDFDALKHNPKLRVIAPYATEIQYIVMTEAGPLASPYARQALSYAFNYDALINGIYRGGYAKRSYGPLASTLLGYDPHVFHYQTNLDKARALLKKAGVKPGTTLTYAYTEADTRAGEILQAQLAQLGITVKLQLMDEAAWDNIFYGNEPASRRPNLMPYGWWPDYNDPYDECDSLLASDEYPPNGSNGGEYHNKQVDALLAQMKYADRQTLIRDAYELQDITGRVDPPAIWVDEPAQATVLAASLHGFVLNPIELRTFDFYLMHR